MVEHHINGILIFPSALDSPGVTVEVDFNVDGQFIGRIHHRLFHHLNLVAARQQQGKATQIYDYSFHNYQEISLLNPLKPSLVPVEKSTPLILDAYWDQALL